MNRKYITLIPLIFFLFANIAIISAQQSPSPQSQVVIEQITSISSHMASSPSDPKVKVIITPRDPTVDDVVDALKKKKQVTVVIWQANDTSRWTHAVRIKAINLTPYNGTNADNETVYYYDVKVYDPTTNSTHNSTLSYIHNKTDTGYLYWYGWAKMIEVVTVYKTHPPKTGTYHLFKNIDYAFFSLLKVKNIFLPMFHINTS